MSKWIRLSHFLTPNTPGYGGSSCFELVQENCINKGDSCNKQTWNLSNHAGTHIDFPKHFYKDGKSLNDFDSSYFISEAPFIVELENIIPGQIIGIEAFSHFDIPVETDFLILKTNWENKRHEVLYYLKNPGLCPDIADFLRLKLPSVRFIGFDFISISSFCHRDIGKKAHKAFLNPEKPILIIEDLSLNSINAMDKLKRVIISPLLVENTDGSPVNIVGELYE